MTIFLFAKIYFSGFLLMNIGLRMICPQFLVKQKIPGLLVRCSVQQIDISMR